MSIHGYIDVVLLQLFTVCLHPAVMEVLVRSVVKDSAVFVSRGSAEEDAKWVT